MDSFGTEVQNISELAYMTWMLCNQKIECSMFTISLEEAGFIQKHELVHVQLKHVQHNYSGKNLSTNTST